MYGVQFAKLATVFLYWKRLPGKMKLLLSMYIKEPGGLANFSMAKIS